MLSILHLLKNQAAGVLNLTFLAVIFYQIGSLFLSNPANLILTSVLIGFYIIYINYRAGIHQTKNLKYSPSGSYKEHIENQIQACGLSPKKILVRYSYCQEMIALANFNTICIDPLVWHGIDEDPQVKEITTVLEQHVLPSLTQVQKEKTVKLKELLTIPAQEFIFKHELGHVFFNYSYKKLILMGAIATVSAYVGLITALSLMPFYAMLALIPAMTIAGLVDLVLSYLSNLLFKSYEEKRADLFAASHSSDTDVLAAADFFEKHQAFLDSYKENTLLAKLPLRILHGYYIGQQRAAYLRAFIAQKTVKNFL